MATHNVASTLITHGSVLAKLVREIEKTTQTTPVDFHTKVDDVVSKLLEELKGEQQVGFPSEECLTKILQKIEKTLDEFTKHDREHVSCYIELKTRVNKSISVIESRTTRKPLKDEYVTKGSGGTNTVTTNTPSQGPDTNGAFNSLSNADSIRLLLFTMFPPGAAIKKNTLLLLWLGFLEKGTERDSINIHETYIQLKSLLTKFVEDGMIDIVAARSAVKRTKLNLKYRLHDGLGSKLKSLCKISNLNSMSILTLNEVAKKAVLNVNEHMLNAGDCDMIYRMLGIIRVLYLGDWNDDPTRYIVVQDMDVIARGFEDLSFLSLQGVSGIVELPGILYRNYSDLRILILRGCHNLELLPDGIQKLSELYYLDLSECYLLNHVPAGIRELSKLVFLKGFIIPKLQNPSHSQALFSDLSRLKNLIILTLRSRRLDFPTKDDLDTLCELKRLITLKVTWVGACTSNEHAGFVDGDTSRFPTTVEKFQIEAASEKTTTRLLQLIARQNDTSVKKLYIRGGDHVELVPNIKCKVLRLQHLPRLQLNCYQMIQDFPNLHRLEMSSDLVNSLLRQSFKIASESHGNENPPLELNTP